MGIFERLSRLIRSNINDLIARAENPEKMLGQIIEDMRGVSWPRRSRRSRSRSPMSGSCARSSRKSDHRPRNGSDEHGSPSARAATIWRSKR
jgi:hypothetical protein